MESPSGTNTEALDILDLTQGIRRRIIKKLTLDTVPTGGEDVEVLLRTLKDADQTELSAKRLGVDSSLAAENAKTNALLGQLFRDTTVDPFKRDSTAGIAPIADVPKPILVDGETSVGVQDLDIDTFMADY